MLRNVVKVFVFFILIIVIIIIIIMDNYILVQMVTKVLEY